MRNTNKLLSTCHNLVPLWCGLFLALVFSPMARAESSISAPHIEVSLLSEVESVQPGEPFTVGVYLQPEEGWHTYWQNSGDTGLPTRIAWTLPEGAAAGELQWPYPERADYQGLTNYGFKRPSLLMAEVTPPVNLSDDSFRVVASVSWLVCEEICIPGRTELDLTLPASRSFPADSANSDLFTATRAELPVPLDYESAIFQVDGRVVAEIQGVPEALRSAEKIQFFPLVNGYMQNALAPTIMPTEDGLRIEAVAKETNIRVPEIMDGLLVVENQGEVRALQFTAQPTNSLIVSTGANLNYSILTILVFALIGGVILNLMPCVFPVLS
jgi:DsbC/DsbD-like thiol-disulfide interchange protein